MAHKKKTARVTLTIDATDPPKEFRIFRKGMNKTSKGDFLFDDEAAKSVMAEYRQHGVDIMIDLEHLSLDSEGTNYDPSAYGWCKLELRGGELWAVNVSWTTAGAQRLRKKESRYISPAFHYLTDNGRITEIYNIAICAVPATYETPALVAASKRVGKQIGTLTIEVGKMDIKKILALLGLDEDATLEDVLEAIKALQDGDGSGEAEGETTEGDTEEEEASDDDEDETATTAAAIKDLDPKVQAQILASISGSKEMKARLAKLEKDQTQNARRALIAANADKLPKSLEKWADKQTVETLSEYFKLAVPVRKDAKTEPKRGGKTATGEGDDGGEVELSKADLKVAKLTGSTAEEMLKLKKERLKKDKEKAQLRQAD